MNLEIFYKSFMKNLEKKASAFFSNSFTKLKESSKMDYDGHPGTDYTMITAPSLPASSALIAQEILKKIQEDPRLSQSSRSKLLNAIKRRPITPIAGHNTVNILLGAGLGAAAMHLLNNYLKTRPGKDSEDLRALAMLSSGALSGGLLGASLPNNNTPIPEESDEWSL